MYADTIKLDVMKDVPERKKLGSPKLYTQSKLGNIVLSNEFARRYGEQGIVSTSLHPGLIETDILRTTFSTVMLLFGWFFSSPTYGALTPLWAGVSPQTAGFNGKYLIPWAREGKMSSKAQDPQLGETLWTWLEAETKE
jgi:NAD(P)-dependent dehydrogenase (short-subunit alcohol dehydrogenase family)